MFSSLLSSLRPYRLRRHAPLLAALAVSLLLHLSLLSPRWGVAPPMPAEPPVLQARLEALTPAPPTPLRTPPAKPPPALRKPAESKAKPAAKAPPAATATATAPTSPPPPRSAPATDTSASAAQEPAPLNPVPAHLQIVYRIRYGPASGRQVLEWAVNKDHYTLSTVIRASGLVGLFYRGRIVQISRGRIGPQGLIPEEFWDERGDYFAQARFDRRAGEVLLQSNRGIRRYPISADIQDALSLLLQIALTAPPPASAEVELFNSKKVRHYLIRTLGEETLDTPLGRLDTLHLAKVNAKPNEETFDLWLAPAYHYLPVKIVRRDPHGLDVSLLAEKISSPAQDAATDTPQAAPDTALPAPAGGAP